MGASLMIMGVAQAALIDWVGGGADTEWSNVDNWETTYVPGNNGVVGDRAQFFAGTDVATVTSEVSSPDLVDIKLRNNGNITISANMTSLRNFEIGVDGGSVGFGTFIKQSAGTVTATGSLQLGTDDNNGGLYELSGTATLDLGGATVIGANGKVSMIGSNASFAAGDATTDTFTMLTTGILDFQFDNSGIGTIAAGAFTVDGTSSALTVAATASTTEGVYELVTFDSMVNTFNTDNITITGLDTGLTGSITYDGNSMNLTVIPEPATIGMLGLGAIITLLIRRWQRS
jgi:hypothetical protein